MTTCKARTDTEQLYRDEWAALKHSHSDQINGRPSTSLHREQLAEEAPASTPSRDSVLALR
jgi:hypothetical protein